jgi:hypothetical protein
MSQIKIDSPHLPIYVLLILQFTPRIYTICTLGLTSFVYLVLFYLYGLGYFGLALC